MKPHPAQGVRCAIYTRKSSEEGLEQDFNSLDAQREACSAYMRPQNRKDAIDKAGELNRTPSESHDVEITLGTNHSGRQFLKQVFNVVLERRKLVIQVADRVSCFVQGLKQSLLAQVNPRSVFGQFVPRSDEPCIIGQDS
jgi:hypothetical protein